MIPILILLIYNTNDAAKVERQIQIMIPSQSLQPLGGHSGGQGLVSINIGVSQCQSP